MALREGSIVRILGPVEFTMTGGRGAYGGLSLLDGQRFTIPAGTEARVTVSEDRWGQDMLVLHFVLPDVDGEVSMNWIGEGLPKLESLYGEDLKMTYGCPFPSKEV